MDDKKKKLIMIIGSVLVIIVIIIVIMSMIKGTPESLSFKELEEKIEKVGKEYYEKNPSLLPKNDGDTREISVDDLVKLELMKPIEEILKEDAICTGKLTVKKENGKYYYVPYIDCGNDYVTSELYKKIIDDNPIVTSGNGLYLANNKYIFRGENINNYVDFANKKWRIIKIDDDSDITLLLDENLDSVIWDDRYNSDKNSSLGINNFSVSRIKDTLNNLYNSDDLFNDEQKKFLSSKSVCIDKIGEDDNIDLGYTCSSYDENLNIGLMDIRDYINASIDSSCNSINDNQCQNYNYLASMESSKSWWTITGDSSNTSKVYYIESFGYISNKNAISMSYIKPTVYINKNVMYISGDGTKDNPYIIE